MNQCDGCNRELPIYQGLHYTEMTPGGKPVMACTKKTYTGEAPVAEVPCNDGVIEPCPFCGDKATLEKLEDVCFVECGNCCGRGEWIFLRVNCAELSAIEAWNKRAL
jgi:hypothetical protein